jgi:hypothetical protein
MRLASIASELQGLCDVREFQVFFADGLLDYVRSTRFQNGVDPRDLVMYWAYCAS